VVHVNPQPVISGWAAVSPWGRTGRDFADGLSRGLGTAAPLPVGRADVPVGEACLVPDFDIATVLGKKGTRSMDRATAMAVAAIDELLGGPNGQRLGGRSEDIGLALGTSTGCVQSTMNFTRDSLTGQRPYLVDPAQFPTTVMNCAAGQSAIWHRLKGPNATVAGGRVTGLLTLQYALRLLRAGRAQALLCGAVEEFSAARAWLAWHARPDETTAPVLGEGAAIWLIERPTSATAGSAEIGRAGLTEVAGLEFGFAADADEIRGALADCLSRLLGAAAIEPGQISVVAESGAPGADGESERAALADVLGGASPRVVNCAAMIGDCYAASAAFQVLAVLALADRGGLSPAWHAVVTSAEAGGAVGAALLRPAPPGQADDPSAAAADHPGSEPIRYPGSNTASYPLTVTAENG
jgi:3-oxoacyl-[acyl-carrier-protein] synthase II